MNLHTKSNVFVRILKRALPEGIRILLRRMHQRIVFRSAIVKFRKNYHMIESSPQLVDDLIYGWGNMGWSSFRDYTTGFVKAARENNGPVLECGSGLSTILLGIIAQDRGFEVWSLEHQSEWHDLVQRKLNQYGIGSVRLSLSPLVRYSNFDWYDTSELSIPTGITLVICDGPPHYTRGGRLGLLPVLSGSLAKYSVILLDDFARPQEQEVVLTWLSDYELEVKAVGSSDPYAHILFLSRK